MKTVWMVALIEEIARQPYERSYDHKNDRTNDLFGFFFSTFVRARTSGSAARDLIENNLIEREKILSLKILNGNLLKQSSFFH